PVCGLAHHFHVGLGVDEQLQARPEDRVFVGDEHTDAFRQGRARVQVRGTSLSGTEDCDARQNNSEVTMQSETGCGYREKHWMVRRIPDTRPRGGRLLVCWPGGVALEETDFDGEPEQLGAAPEAELVTQALAVGLDGLHAQR